MAKAKVYKAVCHTTCYWLETLWNIGDVYEGSEPPIKHFSEDGKIDVALPPPSAADDPRSDNELRKILRDKYQSTKPKSWSRKQLWAALKEFETAQDRDESTAEVYTAKCGFVGKTRAGVAAHERQCAKCNEPEVEPDIVA